MIGGLVLASCNISTNHKRDICYSLHATFKRVDPKTRMTTFLRNPPLVGYVCVELNVAVCQTATEQPQKGL